MQPGTVTMFIKTKRPVSVITDPIISGDLPGGMEEASQRRPTVSRTDPVEGICPNVARHWTAAIPVTKHRPGFM